ncbi:unnamed protein product [Camellia sinensis]
MRCLGITTGCRAYGSAAAIQYDYEEYEGEPYRAIEDSEGAVRGRGVLVPEDRIFGLLSKRLEEGYSRGETGFILDGIPRTRIQAEILDQLADIDLIVNFKCTEPVREQSERERRHV